MKLLSVVKAQSRWLFPVEDMNPYGLDWAPLLEGIRRQYNFQAFPSTPEQQLISKGIRFSSGSVAIKEDRPIAIESVAIFRDGIVAETRRSTALTDSVLDHFLFGLLKEYGFHFESSMLRKKTYLSQLVVSSSIELDAISDKLTTFEQYLSTLDGEKRSFRTAGIAFNTDPENPEDARQFRFERRAGSRFEEMRYFSEAPFATDHHEAAIAKLEQILLSR